MLKKRDFIMAIAKHERFDIKKIFDLLFEVTIREFFDHSNTKIYKIMFNMQRSTSRY